MVAVMQKCKHFAALAENNDTAGRGRCERFPSSACVRGRARLRHRGERKEKDGGEMRRRARGARGNWRDEIWIVSGCFVRGGGGGRFSHPALTARGRREH